MEKPSGNLNAEYISRINRVLDYIERNIDREFTLDELASVAFFSKYHFHRIFNALMGETLFDFIQRTRVEKGAGLLLKNSKTTVTTVAYACGFSSHSLFTRTFKKYFNMSPSRWREEKSNQGQTKSNIVHDASNTGKANNSGKIYVEYSENKILWRFSMDTQ